MKLEELVPPLELCKRIPVGAFADSAMVWMLRTSRNEFLITNRKSAEYYRREMYPAPTLAEILEVDSQEWDTATITRMTTDRTPLATIALRSWLKRKGIEVEK